MTLSFRRLFWIALTLTAFAWRVVGLDRQSLWRDEVDAIYFALRNLNDTLQMFVQAAQNGPLYFLSLRPWFGIAGSTEFALRFPSVVAGTLSVLLVWQIGRRLLPTRGNPVITVATLGAIFMAFNPYQVWYGQEGKMYATITLLVLLATWFWLDGIGRGGWRPWLGYLVTVSIGMYTHLLMVLIIPVHALWFLLAWPTSRIHWRGYGLALAGLTLPYLPMLWWHWWFLVAPEKLSGFNFTPIDQIIRGLALNHARGFLATLDTLWLAPIYFLFGAGLLLGPTVIGSSTENRQLLLAPWRRFALLIAWMVLPVLLIFIISIRQPVFTERYLIWIGPAALLMVALGIRVLWQNTGRFAPVVIAVALIYILGLWTYSNWQQKTLTIKYDLRDAVHYVAARRTPNDLLVLQIPHQEWSYRYYSSDQGPQPFAGSDERLGHWVGGPYTNYGEPDAQARQSVDATMRSATTGVDTIWLMLSEAEMWDSRRLLDEWLNQHGTMEESMDFPGVQVRRYQLK